MIKDDQKSITHIETIAAEGSIVNELFDWCRSRGDILALNSGTILTTDAHSEHINNCKSLLENYGLVPLKVLLVTTALLQEIYNNANKYRIAEKDEEGVELTKQRREFRDLLKHAVLSGVTDIHLEVRDEMTEIRFRRFGELNTYSKWLGRLGLEVATAAFNVETDNAVANFNPNLAQNASVHEVVDGKLVMARIATVPAYGGFDMIVRILAAQAVRMMTLEELGYLDSQIYIIQEAMKVPSGAVIISGPTGSGKTTTIASCLSMVPQTKKIYTIEDPVERVLAHASQIPINTDETSDAYARMTRALLRLDPDDMVIGEVRDKPTAEAMVSASITGHLVLTTVHTKSAINIITRLIDFGISPMLLSDPNLLVCLMSQRLFPKLCPHCSVPLLKAKAYENHLPRWKEAFDDRIKEVRVRGDDRSCPYCFGQGVTGRQVVSEVIWIDSQSRGYIQKNDVWGWAEYLKSNGWKDYYEHMLDYVKEGRCDPLDAEAVVGSFDLKLRQAAFKY